jgi:hypothetical protein
LPDDSPATTPPAAPGGRTSADRWLWVAGFAAGGAFLGANSWATARNGTSFVWYLVDLLWIALIAATFVIQFARSGLLLCVLPILPFWAMAAVRRSIEFVTGGWAGGWALGVAGALVGGLAGVVSGWLFMRRVLPMCLMAATGKRNVVEKPAEPVTSPHRPRDGR